ncbi:hypothetical protein, partial [Citrobacter portucalensis]|uniref:hypothetical protein n=1 Tax=Citrobacter portucalensis TaxID=1639133 RepID=UPI00226B9496
FGGGISQLIGTGGRDLSEKIGGLMMLDAIGMLEADPQTEIIAQRAATEQATDVLLLWSQTGANLFNQRPVERMQIQTLFFHA